MDNVTDTRARMSLAVVLGYCRKNREVANSKSLTVQYIFYCAIDVLQQNKKRSSYRQHHKTRAKIQGVALLKHIKRCSVYDLPYFIPKKNAAAATAAYTSRTFAAISAFGCAPLPYVAVCPIPSRALMYAPTPHEQLRYEVV